MTMETYVAKAEPEYKTESYKPAVTSHEEMPHKETPHEETPYEETPHDETHNPPNPTNVSTTGTDLQPPRHGAVQVAQVRWR